MSRSEHEQGWDEGYAEAEEHFREKINEMLESAKNQRQDNNEWPARWNHFNGQVQALNELLHWGE